MVLGSQVSLLLSDVDGGLITSGHWIALVLKTAIGLLQAVRVIVVVDCPPVFVVEARLRDATSCGTVALAEVRAPYWTRAAVRQWCDNQKWWVGEDGEGEAGMVCESK